jgi:hypothetical protein
MPDPVAFGPPLPRQKATVYLTAADLASDPGPRTTTRYAIVLELGPEVFRWVYGSTDTADDVNIIGSAAGGAAGRWVRTRGAIRGADLTDANATLLVSGDRLRVIPPATITDNRTLTLGATGAVEGDWIQVTRNGTEAFTVTLVNGGAGAGNVAVMPISARSWTIATFDGTNWIHKASGLSLATT